MSPQILRGIESVFDRADRWPVHQLRRITLNVENLCPVYDSVGFVKALFRVLAVKRA